jgi:hypothetical protein
MAAAIKACGFFVCTDGDIEAEDLDAVDETGLEFTERAVPETDSEPAALVDDTEANALIPDESISISLPLVMFVACAC